MSAFRTYGVGLNHVGSYQVSGTPFITSSAPPQDTGATSLRTSFPNVTRRITFKSTSNKDLRIHFAPYTAGQQGYSGGATTNANYVILGGAGSGSVVMDVKCKEVFISATGASATGQVYITAELTSIPTERMFSLDGVSGVTN
jgi:hypothetical protein